MILKIELDNIYDQVYMVRESLSEEESRIFIAGFEDGINEGIGKWLGKAAGWISDIPNKVRKGAKWLGDKARDLYGKGKEWAKKAVDKLKGWMSAAGEKIRGWVSDAGKWISEKYELFVEKMKSVFSAMSKKIVELWEATKEKSKAFWEATKSFFSKMVDSIKSGYKSVKEKLSKMGAGISEWVKKNWVKLKEGLANAKDKLGDLYRRALEAIKKGGAAAKKWLGVVALWLIIKPAKKVSEFFRKIPELYREYSGRLKAFIDKEILDFKIGFEEGAKRPWDREKGFINKTQYPEMKVDPILPEEPVVKNRYKDPLGATIDVSGFLSSEGAALKTKGATIADVRSAAAKLTEDPEFVKRFSRYNERDFKSILRREGFTETAIEFATKALNSAKSAAKGPKSMPIPGAGPGESFESLRYLKTFEGFKY